MAWMKMKQVQAELSVSSQTVYNLVKQGKLKKIKVKLTGGKGHAARFESADVERLKTTLAVVEEETASAAATAVMPPLAERRSKTTPVRRTPQKRALRDLIDFD